jgi:hypothetical protein
MLTGLPLGESNSVTGRNCCGAWFFCPVPLSAVSRRSRGAPTNDPPKECCSPRIAADHRPFLAAIGDLPFRLSKVSATNRIRSTPSAKSHDQSCRILMSFPRTAIVCDCGGRYPAPLAITGDRSRPLCESGPTPTKPAGRSIRASAQARNPRPTRGASTQNSFHFLYYSAQGTPGRTCYRQASGRGRRSAPMRDPGAGPWGAMAGRLRTPSFLAAPCVRIAPSHPPRPRGLQSRPSPFHLLW